MHLFRETVLFRSSFSMCAAEVSTKYPFSSSFIMHRFLHFYTKIELSFSNPFLDVLTFPPTFLYVADLSFSLFVRSYFSVLCQEILVLTFLALIEGG